VTRIYEEIDIDFPAMGSGEEIYKFLIQKSSTGKKLIEAIKNKDFKSMCTLSARLGKIGYSDAELEHFFQYVFHTKNI
jgi:hypothetical protein